MSYKIAIVEDEVPIQQMYKMKLEREGFDVATAANGFEGLKVIERFQPDLVLLDLRMPGMGGEEMLARLRDTEWGNGVRVVILTNISKNEAPHALRFLHVDHYIVKAQHTPTQVVAIAKEVLNIKPVANNG